MKIPSVPPRREPPRVSSLADLQLYRSASTVSTPVKFVLSYTGDKSHYRFIAYIGSEVYCDSLISSLRASLVLDSYVWHAVRGASKEF